MRQWRKMVLSFVIIAVFVLILGACAAKSTPTQSPKDTPVPAQATKAVATKGPAPNGVTARQVQKLLDDAFNKVDRKLALWNIQPGLGTVMIEYGHRIALMHQAAQSGDWGMAQYQLKEATEIQEVGETTRPANASLLKSFEHSYLDKLAKDIQAKDKTSFDADFSATIKGCNTCHKATGHPYIEVQAPLTNPADFLQLAASEPKTPGTKSAAPTATPAPNTALTWAGLNKMVDDAFNKADRQLALWGIQPGLGTVMIEYGSRVALAKHAADAGSWGMAQYQIKEATEIQEVGEITRPGNAPLLKSFEHGYLDRLSKDIQAKDKTAFDADYSSAIKGCNTCHKATGHPYVRVQEPPTSPEAFILALSASEPKAPSEAKPAAKATVSYPAGTPTLADAQKLIAERMNKVDRSLALWAIQPGLGTVMREYGYRFATLWYAAQAQNWGMAQYQLKEATEIQEVGEITRPGNASLLKGFEHSYLDKIDKAIKAKDMTAFESSYKAAILGCNTCHKATGHPYVQVQMPPTAPVDFLKLGENKATQPSATTAAATTTTSFDAAATFASDCSVCHGEKGVGGVANPNSEDGTIPELNSADFAEEFNTAAKIKDVILNGSKPDKAANASGAPIAMPSFKGRFSSSDLDALVAYIQGLSKK